MSSKSFNKLGKYPAKEDSSMWIFKVSSWKYKA